VDGSIASAPAADPAPGRRSPEQDLLERVRRLTERVEEIEDPGSRAAAQELIAAILEMHGAGLAKIGEVLEGAGEAGEEAKRELLADPVVASLLLIHDLYPVPLEERVREALAGVRPYMESHQGDVELLAVEEGVVRLALKGSCEGCPASASTLELAIREALEKAAPDMAGLEVEGVVESRAPLPGPSGIELPVIQSRWVALGAPPPAPGRLAAAEAGGVALAIANVEGELLAFRDRCAACAEPIAAGSLEDGVLACPACERRYYLPRAGRSVDSEQLLLEPVPLLDSGGEVTVAVPG
jgi:Fe-S cluster biogenesis protein NfuA/nitrite reductase/ring-hydroxylating ferredoxin subunit